MDTREVWVTIRATEGERDTFTEAAKVAGTDRSSWIRDVLRRAAAAKLSRSNGGAGR